LPFTRGNSFPLVPRDVFPSVVFVFLYFLSFSFVFVFQGVDKGGAAPLIVGVMRGRCSLIVDRDIQGQVKNGSKVAGVQMFLKPQKLLSSLILIFYI